MWSPFYRFEVRRVYRAWRALSWHRNKQRRTMIMEKRFPVDQGPVGFQVNTDVYWNGATMLDKIIQCR